MNEKIARLEPKMLTAVNDPLEPLLQKAVEAGSVEVLERLLAVKRQVQADAARDAFYVALTAFQATCPVIEKSTKAIIPSKTGASFSYTYTPLEVIAHAIRPLLEQFQLGYRWFVTQQGQSLTVRCRISHALGHIEETELTVPVGVDPMRPAWPVAQSLTYAKRYTLCNALGIVVGGEDDDAQEPRLELTQVIPQSPVPSPSEDNVVIATITDVQVKTGTNAKTGKSWTKWGIVCDNSKIYGTFDEAIGGSVEHAIGVLAQITWKQDGKYLTCTAIELLDPPAEREPGEDDQ